MNIYDLVKKKGEGCVLPRVPSIHARDARKRDRDAIRRLCNNQFNVRSQVTSAPPHYYGQSRARSHDRETILCENCVVIVDEIFQVETDRLAEEHNEQAVDTRDTR